MSAAARFVFWWRSRSGSGGSVPAAPAGRRFSRRFSRRFA